MANTNAPSGFTPLRHFRGGTVRDSAYAIASGLSNSIFTGDLVKPTGTTKQIDVCAAGERSCGVFNGCNYTNSVGDIVYSAYWPASTTLLTGTTCVAKVYDDPGILFVAQASAGFAVTDVGSVADMTAATAGNTSGGVSGQQIDSTTFATSGSAQLLCYELLDAPDNAYGTNAKVAVLINEHFYSAAMTAV